MTEWPAPEQIAGVTAKEEEITLKPWLRFLVYWSLRTKQLCPSEKDCFDVVEVRDAAGALIARQHGPGCHLKMFEASMNSPRGQLIIRVSEIDRHMYAGVQFAPDDLDAREARALLVVKEEKQRYQMDQAKEARDNQE